MSFFFLPAPRQVDWLNDRLELHPGLLIQLDAPEPQSLHFSGLRARQALQDCFSLNWELTASWAVPSQAVGLTLRVAPGLIAQAQGYRLRITPHGILIEGHDPAGIFYGVCTLVQIVRQAQTPALPCTDIYDWPDFPARGVMLDISRDKVYTQETLYDLVDRLAAWKINQLQLYTEHTFAYRQHPEVWEHASPMTPEEILALDVYCGQRFIELVPNQNCFGHMERWLKYPRYAPLAEIHGEFPVPWGSMQGPFSLAPGHPGSLELVRGLLDELLPNFTSRMVNVGCDETFDLGHGQSQAACAERGTHRIYLDFVLQIYREAARRGFKMQFWGDIIAQAPELIPEIPSDVIGLLWGYEADAPFAQQGQHFQKAGVPFYVCPGTSAWNTLVGRSDNCIANQLNAAENGLKYGACGFLNTDWGDNGHWQTLPVSYLGFMLGAAYSWCLEANRSMDIAGRLSQFAFDDPSGSSGRLAYDLGNLYQLPGVAIENSSPFHHLLHMSLEELRASGLLNPEMLHRSQQALLAVAAGLGQDHMTRPDAALVRREFAQGIRLLNHACRRGLLALENDPARSAALQNELDLDLREVIGEFQQIWLLRNRPGGLKDSLAHFPFYG